jgi:LysM repeat protein
LIRTIHKSPFGSLISGLLFTVLSVFLVACGYPTPDRTTGITPFVVVVTPTPAGQTTAQLPTSIAATPSSTTAPGATTVAAGTTAASATGTTAPATTRAAVAPTATPRAPAAGNETTYTVKEGDTLLAIAERLDVDYQELLKVNEIKDPSKLSIGQTLKLPPKRSR